MHSALPFSASSHVWKIRNGGYVRKIKYVGMFGKSEMGAFLENQKWGHVWNIRNGGISGKSEMGACLELTGIDGSTSVFQKKRFQTKLNLEMS